MRMRRGPRSAQGDVYETGGVWMTTMNDLMTLLLGFFVLRVAMSEVKEPPVMVSHALQVDAGFEETRAELTSALEERPDTFDLSSAAYKSGVSLKKEDESLLVFIPLRLIQAPGEEMSFKSATVFRSLALVARDLGRKISLTTVVPRRDGGSPWESSIHLTASLVRQIVDAGMSPEHVLASARVEAFDGSKNEPGVTLKLLQR